MKEKKRNIQSPYTVEREMINRIPISALFQRAKHSTGDSKT